MRLIVVVILCLQIIIAGKKQVYIKISFTLQVYRRDFSSRETAYFNLPPTHCGQHIVSYGGYIKYKLVIRGSGTAIRAADIIIKVR